MGTIDHYDDGHPSQGLSRRAFVKATALASLGGALGMGALPNDVPADGLPGKHPGLTLMSDKPVNAEAPAHLLDAPLTPGELLFVRNNGLPPEAKAINPATWTLTVEGEAVPRKKTYTLAELKTRFKQHTYQLVLECGGNGRAEFSPPAKGLQWTTGAVGCSAWTGVRLADVLRDAGMKSNAVYVGYYGKDTHLNGSGKPPISRGVPIAKALEEESLIAWACNGQDIPWLNGHPLRLVFGGWPGSCSGKWLHRIVVRNRVHDGPKMESPSYRMPCRPVAPGDKVADADMCIMGPVPVKSLITYPKTGATIKPGQVLPIRGHAWAGDTDVQAVHYSIDFGVTWEACTLSRPANRFAWQRFEAKVRLPGPGYYEVWARATDGQGRTQPMLVPGWNPGGYYNNACHRIAIKVGGV